MKKARLIKYILLISAIAILVLFISAVLVVHYFPKEKILTLITSSAESAFKRKVAINEIDYGINGIILKNISIYNKLYDDDVIPESDIFASVKDVNIQFALLPLLKKEFVVKRLVCNNFKINISYDKGKSNLGNFLNDLKSSGDSEIEAKISSVKFKNAEITLKQPPEILKPLEGRYVFNGTVNLASAGVLISDCEIILPEERGAILSDNIGVAILKNNFELTGDLQLRKCSLLWVYKWGGDLSLPFGTFTGNVRSLKISKDFVEGYARGKCVLTNNETVVADGRCKVDINKEIVYLLDIKANIQKSKFTINEIQISARTGIQDRLLKFNISDIDVNLIDIKSILTFLPSDIFGEVSGNISSEKKLYNGTLNLRNVSLRSGQKDIIKINSEIPINNSNIFKEKIPVLIYGQPCQISLSTSGKNFNKIILNLYAKDFNYNISDEEILKKAFTPVRSKSEVTGRMEVENLNIKKFSFSNLVINYSFNDGKLSLNQVNCNFMGGDIKCKGFIDLSSVKPYVNLSAGFDGIKVQNFSSIYNELSGRIFGVAKGNADIEFDVDKDSGISNSLKAKIEVNIDKGKLVNTGLQKGFGIWLSELKYKLNNLEFNKIYGNLNVIGNNFYVNSALFTASDIRLKMDGYFSKPLLETKKIPGELKIDLEFNDYFIQDIPNLPQAQFISKLLTIPALKKKGEWYMMSFKDKGEDITDGNNVKPQ